MKQARRTILQIAAVTAFSSVLALIFNEARVETLPLVMPFPPEYQCPSGITEGLAIGLVKALGRHGRGRVVFVDARSKNAFEKGRIEGAISLPYSFLDPVAADDIARLKDYGTVIVYCNSESAERSMLMAGELSNAGLKSVYYLEGGLLGWVKAQGSYRGKTPENYE